MCPSLIVVLGVSANGPAQVIGIKDDQTVQALPSDRADHPLDIAILPGGLGRNLCRARTHRRLSVRRANHNGCLALQTELVCSLET